MLKIKLQLMFVIKLNVIIYTIKEQNFYFNAKYNPVSSQCCI
ncbi:Uncharacterised protein [Streptococcus pyogenes]|nr:Uncharacterised protein [Streptococcus pyogenes]SQH23855.1 Uncharacterised protein [Streptococcus pyogenes]SUO62208.1 Uncharacterised protein [Streptococcus pyogenes]VED84589.1 Uncharacterised protein [Streptococcus pyogenes]VGS83786.1 Uncharacterised protein [Streptococcus pyogenes]